MPTYQYEAMDHTGREVKDTINASTQEEAQQLIRQKGFFVTKISERAEKKKGAKAATAKRAGGRKKKKSFTIGKISTKQLCTFTRQLSTLQDAGLPILRSLKILEGQCKPGVLKNALGEVVEDIESGSTLSEAFAKHPKAFDRLYCNMIKAGEAGGALESILQRLADFKEKSQSLKRRIKSAMVYPIVVIFVACVIVGFILYFIIPKFEAIFKDFGVPLPQMTIFLIAASHFVIKYFYLVFMFPLFVWIIIKLLYRNRTGAYVCDRILLMIPVMGAIVEKSTVARTTRTLGTLVQSGVPILEALEHRPRHGGQRRLRARLHADLREHPRGGDDRAAAARGADRRRHRGQHDRRRRGDGRARHDAQQDRRQLR